MSFTPALPTDIAYFDVYVPVSDNVDRPSRAEEIVQRYLYGRFSVDGCVLQHADGEDVFESRWLVRVRYECTSPLAEPWRDIQNQRDRLSSGLYGSTEPTFYRPIES